MQNTKVSNIGIFTILLISSLTIMVGTVIAPSLYQISVHLGFSKSPGWLVTLPSLGVVLFAPIMGKLIDLKGAYKMMSLGLVPYALLGIGGAFLKNPILVVIDRLLLGGATAVIQASGTVLIAELFLGQERMKMIAWQGMAIEVGGVAFLSVGGILGGIDWFYPFFIYLIALICIILQKITIPKISTFPKTSNNKKLKLIYKTKTDRVVIIVLYSLLAMILFFTAFVGLPLFLPLIFKFSESQTGYFMAFISLVAVICASQMPKFVSRIGTELTVGVGFLFFYYRTSPFLHSV